MGVDARVSSAGPAAAAHAKVGLGVSGGDGGGVVVVRPDGHVGCVVRLVEGRGTVDALEVYFARFVRRGLWGGRGEEAHAGGEGVRARL